MILSQKNEPPTLCKIYDRPDNSHMGLSLLLDPGNLSSDLWRHSLMNDEAWIRDGHEQQERHGQRLSSAAPNTKSASHSSSPGILVFSHRRQLLHMNRRALDLTGHLEQAETGPPTMTISRLVSQLRIQIQDILDSRVEANVWEFFECKRVMVESGRTVLLRGFGLPNRNSSEHSRVIIILEEVSLQQERGTSQEHATLMIMGQNDSGRRSDRT